MMKVSKVLACFLFLVIAEARGIEKNGKKLVDKRRSVPYGSETPVNIETNGEDTSNIQIDNTPGSGVDIALRSNFDAGSQSRIPLARSGLNNGPFLRGTSLEHNTDITTRITHPTPQSYSQSSTRNLAAPQSYSVFNQVPIQERNFVHFTQPHAAKATPPLSAPVQVRTQVAVPKLYTAPVTRTIAVPVVRRVYIPVPVPQDYSIGFRNFEEPNVVNVADGFRSDFGQEVRFLDDNYTPNLESSSRSGFDARIGAPANDGLLRSYVPSIQGGIDGHTPYVTEWRKTW